MKSITTPIIITGIRSKVDRSLGLTMSTPELSTQEKAIFLELQGINCRVTITPTETEKIEEYQIQKDLDQKPPSVRMRNVLYLLFKQNQEGHADFDSYYRAKMEKFIDHLKSKLDE